MSREAQRNNFRTGFSRTPRASFKGLASNQVIPRYAYLPVSNSDSQLPGGVIPYNDFYFTTVTNNPNNQSACSTGNLILPSNRAASVAANSVMGRSSSRGSLKLPAAMRKVAAGFTENKEELKPDGDPSVQLDPNAVSPRRFVNYATNLARLPNSSLAYQFLPFVRTEADQVTLEALSFLLSANNAFGIYSESPFLRPVTLLRPVRFASPANVLSHHPDPENMVRTLQDLANQKVTSIPLLAILSGAKPNAASLGFYTDYLTYSFTLDLDIHTMRLLVEQSRQSNNRTDKYRLILRLAWATTGLYMPRDKPNPSRVLASEVLPRCLSVRVARRNVTLPDPIFHGGQAQKLGHRLRFAIDITDKIPVRPNSSVRDRSIEIDLTWLHAPLEDHALPLLEMVGSGSCTPILNHLLNLPLIQVTLDRVQPIPEFVRMFSSAVAGKPVIDPPPGSKPPHLPPETPEALVGVYDFCRSADRVIAASKTLAMVKAKLTSEDDLQCDEWIPVSLLCPLTLTRIDIPVRSANCDHLQCFDLSSYLTINKKRPRWSCPVCSSPAPFRDLRRDDFFVQLMADQSLKNAEMVHVDANGHWREAPKPAESASSAVISVKESMPVSPSLSPTTTAVQSLLNGTAAMSACRPETPIELDVSQFNDCVVLLDDDDDGVTQEGDEMQPEKPSSAHPTSSNDCHGPPLHTAVPDKKSGKFTSTALDSAPRNLFVDLATSSDDESDAMASAPPLSNPQLPATLASAPSYSATTENCGLLSVVPPSSLARLRSSVTSSTPAASLPLNLAESATQPPLPPPPPAAAVSTSRNSSAPQSSVNPYKLNTAIDITYELISSLASSVGSTTAVAASTQLPPAVSLTIGTSTPTKPTHSGPQIETLTATKRRRRGPQVEAHTPQFIQYCQVKNLLPTVMWCRCGRVMNQQIFRQHTDGYVFRCNRCGGKRALRTGSIFEKSKLTIQKIMRVFLAFLCGKGAKECASAIGLNHGTALEWYGICRTVCSKALRREVRKIGGPGVEVLVDEARISRRKFNVGRKKRQHRIMGMYDTVRKKALFKQIHDRSWPSLRAVIKKWVIKGSIIVTNEWKGYARLPLAGYQHCTVNYSKNLVDPTTGRHTNAIEGYWRRLKRKLRKLGQVSGRSVWAHMDEVQYRLWFGVRTDSLPAAWETFLGHIADAYPVNVGAATVSRPKIGAAALRESGRR
uniref:SP-RING-type domain-containing protein n=1 Tax=Schistocephalus solidus TaxID=70667 RepID=A0A0X3NRX0_SCHSO